MSEYMFHSKQVTVLYFVVKHCGCLAEMPELPASWLQFRHLEGSFYEGFQLFEWPGVALEVGVERWLPAADIAVATAVAADSVDVDSVDAAAVDGVVAAVVVAREVGAEVAVA